MIKDLTSDEEKIIELYRSLDDYRKQVGYMNLVLLQTCKEIDEQPCEIIDFNSGKRYDVPEELAKCTKLDGEKIRPSKYKDSMIGLMQKNVDKLKGG